MPCALQLLWVNSCVVCVKFVRLLYGERAVCTAALFKEKLWHLKTLIDT